MVLVKIFQHVDDNEQYKSTALLGLANDEEEAYEIVQDFMRFMGISYLVAGNLEHTDWDMDMSFAPEELFYDEVLYPTAPIEYFDIRVAPYSDLDWGKKPEIDLSDVTIVGILRNMRNNGYNLNELDLSGFELDMDDPEIAELFAE